MVVGKERVSLTKEEILKRVSEYDIYRYFLGYDFKPGKVMHSPMPGRKDNHPSFIVGVKGGNYFHKDFADSRYSGNCFQFVMQKEMLPNYNSALIQIDQQMGLGIRGGVDCENSQKPVFIQPNIEDTKPKFFQVEYSKIFTEDEKLYWKQFYISPSDCLANEIFAVRKYWIDRRLQPMRKLELTFAYRSGPLWKIYRPYACKRRKWQTNFPNTLVEGMSRVSRANKGIITKSRKDRIILQRFLPSVVSTQNESTGALPGDDVIRLLANWDNVYLAFDGDGPGRENAKMVLEEHPGLVDLSLENYYKHEGITDFGEMIIRYGPGGVEEFLKDHNVI